jgi:SAM-dependent methyltransferase
MVSGVKQFVPAPCHILRKDCGCAMLLPAKEGGFCYLIYLLNFICMDDIKIHTFADIDWAYLRANAFEKKAWRNRGQKEWDAKANSFAARNKSAAYIDLFLALLPLESTMSVLDVGSGPGTLAIPMAGKVRSITAIDFSRGMLQALNDLASTENISNIKTVHCAWEDDWQAKGLQPHDIAIASRAMGVKDLQAALKKIDAYATRYVFLSDRIGSTPFDVAAFTAIGRPFVAGPDYIYTINILYTLGIHPNISVLTLDREVTFNSMAEAISSYIWMFNDITADEKVALAHYLQGQIIKEENNQLTLRRAAPPRWAVIWWQK